MSQPSRPSRRERLRTATMSEIKAVARGFLTEGGPSAISLRAIAREMGMTATATYSYYPSLDSLVTDLRDDLFDELRRTTEAARDQTRGDDPMSRLNEMARAFRRWALEHPREFGLMLGPPVPGVSQQRDRGEPDQAMARFGAAFLAEFAQLARRRRLHTPPAELIEKRLGPYLGTLVADQTDELPLPVVFVFLTAWPRLFGLVAMEVFGHVEWAVTDVEALFETELVNFAQQLTGTSPSSPPS